MRLIKKVNSWFISLILVIVYYFGIGISYVLYLFLAKTTNQNLISYWQQDDKVIDFNSEY
jgi:hypothetical protein